MQRRSPQDPRGPGPNVQPSGGFKTLANINVPSLSSFLGKPTSKGVRRASSVEEAPSRNLDVSHLPVPQQYSNGPSRAASFDSAAGHNLRIATDRGSAQLSPMLTPRDLDQFPHGLTPSIDSGSWHHPLDIPITNLPPLPPLRSSMIQSTPRPLFNRGETSYHTAKEDGSKHSSSHSRSTNRSSYSQTKNLRLELTSPTRDPSADRNSDPKSPGNKLTSFFGWKPAFRDSIASPTSEFSFAEEQPLSRALSQPIEEEHSVDDEVASVRSMSPLPFAAPEVIAHVDELLQELRDVSAELAASIRREMELEDEVEGLKIAGQPIPMDNNRRTSDYYSDSGSGSTRSTASTDYKIQGLEKMRRKAEQEKAQLRITMAQKVQEDLNQRKALEMHVQTLEEQLSGRDRGLYEEPSARELELETALEDMKRRLMEERRQKDSLESQLAVAQTEMEKYENDRDNLRDEVVPRLRARIDGLESETSEFQTLVYENTRMQQEIDSLKNEKQTLLNARKLQIDSQQQQARFRSIAEEDGPPSMPASPMIGVGRSSSRVRERSGSFAKANVTKDGLEFVPDRVKDVEDQRDALHQTLKQLILRLNSQQREHARQIKAIEAERDKALSGTPRRAAFNVEVKTLRLEVNHLRRRADDALEQKWNCEKGLSGLKTNLDRAQQETSSLRGLLKQHDILIPSESISVDSRESDDATVMLDTAYQSLRNAHAKSIAQLEDMVAQGQEPSGSVEAAKTRMYQLRDQVQQQLAANKNLKDRLMEAVSKGESEQGASAKKIVELESALRAAEEKVLAAQSHSEDAVARQEEHVKTVQQTLTQQVRRGLSSPSSARLASPTAQWMGLGLLTSPTTPSDLLFGAKSPRLDQTSSGQGLSVSEEGKTELLEERVRDLEIAASTAESEMQLVVERMNKAQIEVAELQTERDEAMRRTRRLQKEIEAERIRVQGLAA